MFCYLLSLVKIRKLICNGFMQKQTTKNFCSSLARNVKKTVKCHCQFALIDEQSTKVKNLERGILYISCVFSILSPDVIFYEQVC